MSARLVPPGARELPALTALRLEVRAFLAEQVVAGAFVPHVDTWLTRWDRDFTRELGRRGWLGMVIPTEYGGQGRTYLERFVVTEELLVVGRTRGRALDRGAADRAVAAALRHGGAEAGVPAGHQPRRGRLRHRDERARLRAPTSPACAPGPNASTAAGA